jgi:uncharacterized protein
MTATTVGFAPRSRLAVRDGARLAVDVYRPTICGAMEPEPPPVVWTAKRYLRAAIVADGRLSTLISDRGPMDRPAARKLITRGYVLAAPDMRGTTATVRTAVAEDLARPTPDRRNQCH